MPREIYNEGRVVGYSAWEIYVRHHNAIDPDNPPASEKEWLASTISLGSSMLLKITPDTITGNHYRDFQLPENSRLCAANTIIGSCFIGEGNFKTTNSIWADSIKNYGPLIDNDNIKGSKTSTDNIPSNLTSSTINKRKLKQYMKIVDGVVIQPGNWSHPSKNETDLQPDLTQYPRIRLYFTDKIENEFYLLLTGFTIRSVVQGISGTDTSVNTNSPQDGDFLGPAVYPWANKIVFSIPPSFFEYFMNSKYKRKLDNAEAPLITVDSDPIIDMKNCDPAEYYDKNEEFSTLPINLYVDTLNTYSSDASVLTVYSRLGGQLPPALYGAIVTENGEDQKIYPIDTNAPGTLKLFDGDDGITKAQKLEHYVPHNTAFIRDSDYIVSQLKNEKDVIPVAKSSTDSIKQGNSIKYQDVVTSTQTGSKITKSLSLIDSSGNYRDFTGVSESINHADNDNREIDFETESINPGGNFNWSDLLEALSSNKSVNVFPEQLVSLINSICFNLDGRFNINRNAYGWILGTTPHGEITLYDITDSVRSEPEDNKYSLVKVIPHNSESPWHYIGLQSILMPGNGITISGDVGSKTIESHTVIKKSDNTEKESDTISAGNGIRITDEGQIAANISDGLVFSEGKIAANIGQGLKFSEGKIAANIGQGLKFSGGKIAANIENGNGISVNTDENTGLVTIENTLPYYGNSDLSEFPNPDSNLTVFASSSNNFLFQVSSSSSSTGWTKADISNVKSCIKFTQSDDDKTIYLEANFSDQDKCVLSNTNLNFTTTSFAFKHGNKMQSGLYEAASDTDDKITIKPCNHNRYIIAVIQFKGNVADLLDNYDFNNTSENVTGTWNVNPKSIRAAWNCAGSWGVVDKSMLGQKSSEYTSLNTASDKIIVLYANGYPDGYNEQFYRYNELLNSYNEGKTPKANISVNHINFKVTAQLTVKDGKDTIRIE